jgi:hypothetical protein
LKMNLLWWSPQNQHGFVSDLNWYFKSMRKYSQYWNVFKVTNQQNLWTYFNCQNIERTVKRNLITNDMIEAAL